MHRNNWQTLIGYWPLPLGIFLAAILLLVVASSFNPPSVLSRSTGIEFILNKYESARSVAQHLKKAKIIDNPTKFVILAKLLNYERKLKKGKYNLVPGMDELSVLKILVTGGQTKTFVTIPEGKTLEQTAEILQEQNICAKGEFLKIAQDKNFLLTMNIKAKRAEGYLFPDSYEFEIFSEPREVITRLIKRFLSIYKSLLSEDSGFVYAKERENTKNFLNDHDIVILASIVEAEARLEQERPIIASVFLNRLKQRYPLQSCATVEYVLQERKSKLTIQDLKINSPYNTYLHQGLPPGPICNPSRNSLKAALFPAKTKYLFFVSRGDGSHHFSKTNREHQVAIRRYKKYN